VNPLLNESFKSFRLSLTDKILLTSFDILPFRDSIAFFKNISKFIKEEELSIETCL